MLGSFTAQAKHVAAARPLVVIGCVIVALQVLILSRAGGASECDCTLQFSSAAAFAARDCPKTAGTNHVPDPRAGELSPANKGLPAWANLMAKAQAKLRPTESIFGWWMHDTNLRQVFPDAAHSFESYREIGNAQAEDKTLMHRYDLAYAQLLEPVRALDVPVRVLEIGIGCEYPREGASVRTMGQYLPTANLTLVEFSQTCSNGYEKHKPGSPKGGWQFYLADGTKKATARKVLAEANGERFDLVLEDASHLMQHQIDSFHAWWPLLKVGGVYVCEDLHTSFMWDYTAEVVRKNGKTGSNFFNYLQTRVHAHPSESWFKAWEPTMHKDRYPAEPLASVQCFWSICFVYKNDDRPLRIESPWQYSGSD